MSYGEKITFLRKRSGMTQSELGEKLNITYQAVSKWERDESDPDFSTMSKIARIFNVPLSFFEEDVESTEDTAVANTGSELDAETLRQILEEHDTAQRERAERERLEREAAERERLEREEEERRQLEEQRAWEECIRAERERAEQERIEKERQWAENARRAQIEEERQKAQHTKKRRVEISDDDLVDTAKNKSANSEISKSIERRNRGLIASTFITLALVVTTLILTLTSESFSTAGSFLLAGVLVVFMFPFIAQLFWDGFIVDLIFTGFQVVGTPGIIFDFSLDGLIFLIAMKILFAVLRIVLMILIFLFFLFLAIVASPFAFIPQVIKLSLGKELDL